MKYHFIEHDTYREILKYRDEIKNSYVKAEKSLNDKKERLFRTKDFGKWGYLGELNDIESKADNLFLNKEAAFTYMLQKETKALELQKEELSFYSN